jgi:sigma-B regulation protein RsbU (phosphoserine phosphatase)
MLKIISARSPAFFLRTALAAGVIAILLGFIRQHHQEQGDFHVMKSAVGQLADLQTREDLYRFLTVRLLRHCRRPEANRESITALSSRLQNQLTEGTFRFAAFDRDGRFWFGSPDENHDMEKVWETLNRTWRDAMKGPVREYRVAAPFFQGFSWNELTARPDTFYKLYHREEIGWGMWDRIATDTPDGAGGAVGGILLLTRNRPDSTTFLLRKCVEELRHDGCDIGFHDRLCPTNSLLPRNILPEEISQPIERYMSGSAETFGVSHGRILLAGFQGLAYLIGRLPARPFPWAWAILAGGVLFPLVITFLHWLGQVPFSHSPSIRAVFLLLMSLAAIIPFLTTSAFVAFFEKSHIAAAVFAGRKHLENRLIRLDQFNAAIQNSRRTAYQEWGKKLAALIPRNGSIPTRSGKKKSVPPQRAFPDNHPAFQLVTETKQWELSGLVDATLIVGSMGHLLKGYSDSSVLLRNLSLLDRPQREKVGQELYYAMGVFSLPELGNVVLNDRFSLEKDFFNYHIRGDFNLSRFISIFSQEAIKAQNSRCGIAASDRDEKNSSLMMSSFLEFQGGSFIDQLVRHRGDFTWTGQADFGAAMYFDIIPNPTGAGEFAFWGFHYQTTLAQIFWDALQPYQQHTPRRYQLFSHSICPYGWNLPTPRLPDDIRVFTRHLRAPQVLVSRVEQQKGEEVILAGLLCRFLKTYSLIARQPVAEVLPVDIGWSGLSFRVTALLVIGLGGIVFWLNRRLLQPVNALLNGMKAMEQRDLDHVVQVTTGDELSDLADAFNETIEGMKELHLARIVQQQLFPQEAVAIGPLSFLGQSIMLSGIGGDYYDARLTTDGRLAFIFGDVSGHGVSAALVVAMAKAAFSSTVRSGAARPEEILVALNQIILGLTRKTKMMTCVTGIVDETGTAHIANAGHIPPFLLAQTGECRQIENLDSVPLGIMRRPNFPTASLTISPGEFLVMMTDGIPEASDPTGRVLEYQHVPAFLRKGISPEPMTFITNLQQNLRSFTGPAPWQDDVTIALISHSPKMPADL